MAALDRDDHSVFRRLFVHTSVIIRQLSNRDGLVKKSEFTLFRHTGESRYPVFSAGSLISGPRFSPGLRFFETINRTSFHVERPMDSYVVRIYRRDARNPGKAAGIVEFIERGRIKSFTSVDELVKILGLKDRRTTGNVSKFKAKTRGSKIK
jgi:hypothetical protein